VATLLNAILAGLFRIRWIRDSNRLDYAYAEWQAGSTLQLQRLAQEGVGAGTWINATDAVPTTSPGDTLAVVDLTDRRHPRLAHSSISLARINITGKYVDQRPSARYARLPSVDQL
jgi:hypothetical protein